MEHRKRGITTKNAATTFEEVHERLHDRLEQLYEELLVESGDSAGNARPRLERRVGWIESNLAFAVFWWLEEVHGRPRTRTKPAIGGSPRAPEWTRGDH